MMADQLLANAELIWRAGEPCSSTYGDRYFDQRDGAGESQYVFIDANRLNERWAAPVADPFTILETGFGSGLNLLITVNNWIKDTNRTERLIYIAVEGHPLSRDDARRLLASCPESVVRDWLIENWPVPMRGIHHLVHPQLRFEVLLVLDDIDAGLDQIVMPRQGVDAVFLDGFAPARNPAMWRHATLDRVTRLCRDGATFATFTAVGDVRRTLQRLGFNVERYPGFGRKRDMLRGTYCAKRSFPKSHRQWTHTRARANPGRIVVIGAGLAGSSVAYALARRGFAVNVVCAETQPPALPSANRGAAWFPAVTADLTPRSRFLWHAVSELHQHLRARDLSANPLPGALFLALDDVLKQRYQACARLLGDAGFRVSWHELDAARDYCGLPVAHPGLALQDAGVVDARELCRRWLTDSRISVTGNCQVTAMHFDNNAWQLSTMRGADSHHIEADTLILASGVTQNLFASPWQDHVESIIGAVSHLHASPMLAGQQRLLCYGGFAAPPAANVTHHSVGATWAGDADGSLDHDDAAPLSHRANLDWLSSVLEHSNEHGPSAVSESDLAGGFTARRLTTSDRLPIVGPVTDNGFNDLYVSTGHGSRGATTSLLSAEIIAALIASEPLPVSLRIYTALHPMRFSHRLGDLEKVIR